MFIRRRFAFVVRECRFCYGAFANDWGLPKRGIAIVLRSKRGGLVSLFRGFLARAKGGGVGDLYYAANGSGLVCAANVSGLARHDAKDFVWLYDLLEGVICSPVRVNVGEVMFVCRQVGRRAEFLDHYAVIRVGRELPVRHAT